MAGRQATRRRPDDEDDDDRSTGAGTSTRARRPVRELLRAAAGELAELTGCEVAGVSALERTDDGWRVDVEVVELRRVPDTTSVLATYEVELDDDGEVVGYRRVRRYNRASTEDM